MKTNPNVSVQRNQGLLLAIVLAGVIAIAFSLAIGADKAWAGGQPDGAQRLEDLKPTSTITTTMKSSDDTYRDLSSLKSWSKKISNAKSSNKKVATVKVLHHKYGGKHYYNMQIALKGKGKTTLSFKWGAKQYKIKYVVKSYANPVKTFKVGTKNYAAGFAAAKQKYPTPVVVTKAKSLTGKLNLKLAKGWKLRKAWYWQNNKLHFIKNGGKVTKAQAVWVSVQKGSLREQLYVYAGGTTVRKASTSSTALKAASL